MRKIAVIDIDGVLNSERWLADTPPSERPHVALPGARRWRPGTKHQPTTVEPRPVAINPEAVLLLNYLVREGVEFVLSSTWRGDGTKHGNVSKILQQLGWAGELIGSTPVLRSASTSIHVDHSQQPTRGDEILAWLEREGIELEQLGRDVKLAIIDDDDDLGELADYWTETNGEVGLQPADIMRAAILLDEPLVMVDHVFKPYRYRTKAFRKGCSHLTVSGTDERHIEALHGFARAMSRFPREWFQDHRIAPHYDLTRGHHARALACGALLVHAKDQARVRHWARRKGLR